MSPGHPADDMFVLSHLFRIRRLLEVGRADPGSVTPLLRAALREAREQWPDAYAQKVQDRTNGKHGYDEPPPFDTVRLKAVERGGKHWQAEVRAAINAAGEGK